jgi:bacillopeptidase F (M6 metalloprotease family)
MKSGPSASGEGRYISWHETMLGGLRSRSDPTVGSAGRSACWEQWSIDLSRYAGKQVEISIAYLSDWSIQGLGAFVDDTA